jgi:chemotaxis protein CheX
MTMTSSTAPNLTELDEGDVYTICREVWESYIDPYLVPFQSTRQVADEERITGCVLVSGQWQGAVVVECSDELATRAAAIVYSCPADELTHDEIVDAVGEFANMIGGNIKSLLPGPSTLSTPTVTDGPAYLLRVPNALPMLTFDLSWNNEPFAISVLSIREEI